MSKSRFPFLALSLLVGASSVEAQSFEVHGNLGRTFVDVEEWANDRIEEPSRLAWGGAGQLIFGQAGPGATQFSVEGSFQHFLTYDPSDEDEPTVSENAFAGVALARVWIGEGASFFEAGLGAAVLDRGTDPVVTGGLGKFLGGSGGRVIPIKLRLTAIFDGDTVLLPLTASIGLHFGS